MIFPSPLPPPPRLLVTGLIWRPATRVAVYIIRRQLFFFFKLNNTAFTKKVQYEEKLELCSLSCVSTVLQIHRAARRFPFLNVTCSLPAGLD
jgi:hypothetical protein